MAKTRFLIVWMLLLMLIVPLAVSAQENGVAPWTGTYTVQPGDNLFRIALRYNVSTALMAQMNGIGNASWIYAGQVLRVPGNGNPGPFPPPTPVPSQPQPLSVAVYANTALYESQSFAASVRATLPAQIVSAVGRSSDTAWIYVRTSYGVVGWAWVGSVGADPVLLIALPVVNPTGPLVPDSRSVVVPGSLAVVQTPVVNAPVVAGLSAGMTVTVNGRSEDSVYVHISAYNNAVQGWVWAVGLQVPGSLLNSLPITYYNPVPLPVPTQPAPVGLQAQIVRNGIPLRVAPGGQTGIVRNLSAQNVTANGRSWDNTWLRVRTSDGSQGWVWLGDTNLTDQSILILPQLN